jgi:hypothetical protein
MEDIDTNNIRNLVLNLLNDIRNQYINNQKIDTDLLDNNHLILKNDYPTLYKMIIQGDDLDMLEPMLIGIENIQKQPHKLKKEEIKLGNLLKQKYIDPIINK